jgi:hypothetical protein
VRQAISEGLRNLFRRVPFFMLNRLLKMISFFSYTMNLDLRWAGIPRDPFGSAMITNIGSLGLDEAYVPLVPYSRVPLLLAMGAVDDAPVVQGDTVVPGKVMKVCATFDHRILDGAHAAVMSRTLRDWMEHPFDHFDPIPVVSPQGTLHAEARPCFASHRSARPAARPAAAQEEEELNKGPAAGHQHAPGASAPACLSSAATPLAVNLSDGAVADPISSRPCSLRRE